MQVAQARTILQRMAAIQQMTPQPVLPLLLGDFNASAYSGVYRFLAEGFLDCSLHGRRDLSGQLQGIVGGERAVQVHALIQGSLEVEEEVEA